MLETDVRYVNCLSVDDMSGSTMQFSCYSVWIAVTSKRCILSAVEVICHQLK